MTKRIRRALVVDDDQAMVRTLADVLRLKGWEVTTAFSGQAAVTFASHDTFDVVLMDIKMPGMDGVAAFKAMKALKPDVRVVLMTAYAAEGLVGEAEREGVVRVLPKPIDIAALLQLLADNARGSRPLLLIDSDIAFLKTLSDVLTLRGFPTAVATDLAEAGRLMAEGKPAAVLLHMHLGPVSVRDAVAAVHSLSPAVSLILYSGKPGAQQEIARLPGDWVSGYLQKPFAMDQVIEVLSAVGSD